MTSTLLCGLRTIKLGSGWTQAAPGLIFAAVAVAGSLALNHLLPTVGPLTWAVVLGIAVSNLGVLPTASEPGLKIATKRLLRLGIVLLGFSLSLGSIIALGIPLVLVVLATVITTFSLTLWAGQRLGLARPRSLLIATGFSICGASAVAAMQETSGADEDDAAGAIAMVTLWGTLAMILVPLAQPVVGLDDQQLGAWAGASVHEVGQVVAAASPAGGVALSVAVVVKLSRVLLLAPLIASVSLYMRWRVRMREGNTGSSRQPLVPVFVLGFLSCVLLRSAGLVPTGWLAPLELLQTLALTAALFGLGAGVKLASLLRGSGRTLALSGISTIGIAAVALAGAHVAL